jgi:hypothetical protein
MEISAGVEVTVYVYGSVLYTLQLTMSLCTTQLSHPFKIWKYKHVLSFGPL